MFIIFTSFSYLDYFVYLSYVFTFIVILLITLHIFVKDQEHHIT